jgi:hypothetical protein
MKANGEGHFDRTVTRGESAEATRCSDMGRRARFVQKRRFSCRIFGFLGVKHAS